MLARVAVVAQSSLSITDLTRRQVAPGEAEFPIYVALKLAQCERALRGGAGKTITARRTHMAIVGRRPSETAQAELFDTSSYFVRERLKNLNHGTVLKAREETGPLSQVYDWNEALNQGTLQSYRELRAVLGGRVHLALDVYRLSSEFGSRVFTVGDFVQWFKQRREGHLARRWYSLSTRKSSAIFGQFLHERLQQLVAMGLVAPVGRDGFQATRKAELAAHWLDLLLNSVDYPAAR